MNAKDAWKIIWHNALMKQGEAGDLVMAIGATLDLMEGARAGEYDIHEKLPEIMTVLASAFADHAVQCFNGWFDKYDEFDDDWLERLLDYSDFCEMLVSTRGGDNKC